MRIAHLLLTSRFAGTERHALELAEAQSEHHDVTLVLRRAGAEDRADAIAHRAGPRVKVEVVGNLFSAWHARRLLQRLQPDVAHAHLSAGCKALHGLRIDGVRVATLHIEYKAGQHAPLDGLIAIAPWQLDAIPQPLRAHSMQIDNWTLPREPDATAGAQLRALHGIAEDQFLIGALGRTERSKGLDVLIEAFRRAQLPGARLAIVGQGREWQALRRQAGPDVLMPGFAERPQDWLAAFDGFVSAARSEPFGLVLLEAMQAGLPIVASETQGARHLASHLRSPLVAIDDPDALAAALRQLAAAGRHRLDYPMQEFRIEAKLPQIEAFYRAGMARRRGNAQPSRG
jgi:glycosyltransferase involved in cell wall biosynthesis